MSRTVLPAQPQVEIAFVDGYLHLRQGTVTKPGEPAVVVLQPYALPEFLRVLREACGKECE